MTEKEFNKKFNGVAGPLYRGAAYPKFDPAAINESEFEDECRHKEVNWELDEDKNELAIDWLTQESADKHTLLWKEVKRCLEHIGFDGQVNLTLTSRDGGPVYTLTKRFAVTIAC